MDGSAGVSAAMRMRADQNGRRIVLTVAITFVCASAAMAQDAKQDAKDAANPSSEIKVASLPPATAAAPADNAVPDETPPVALSPEDRALLDKLLTADAFRFGADRPPPRLRYRSLLAPNALDVTRANGGNTIVVKQPLPTEWDVKVGADLGPAATPSNGFTPDNPFHVVHDDAGSGAAWASLAVPQLATVDARLDPTNDRGRLGTTFSRSLPLGQEFAVTLQSQASLTESYGPPQAATSDIPLAVAPAAASDPDPHVWGNVNSARFDILATGTTLAAGLSSTSTDPVTHSKLSAEQKIYGALNLATAVTDIGQPFESRSISARFKLNW